MTVFTNFRCTLLTLAALLGATPLLVACSQSGSGIDGYDELERHVSSHKVGQASDHWIEMQNLAGAWERVGLIFGYIDDYDECRKAVGGLRRANEARQYRCVPANQ